MISYNNIPFTAKYIASASVLKADRLSGKEEPCNVSFIELDPLNPYDTDTVSTASKIWGSPEYSKAISNSMQSLLSNNERNIKQPEKKFYAITSQRKYFTIANPEEILGLCELLPEDKVRISYLQVKPDSYLEYNHIGSSMLGSLKNLYKDKILQLCAVKRLKPFYHANGFKESKDNSTIMYFEA